MSPATFTLSLSLFFLKQRTRNLRAVYRTIIYIMIRILYGWGCFCTRKLVMIFKPVKLSSYLCQYFSFPCISSKISLRSNLFFVFWAIAFCYLMSCVMISCSAEKFHFLGQIRSKSNTPRVEREWFNAAEVNDLFCK